MNRDVLPVHFFISLAILLTNEEQEACMQQSVKDPCRRIVSCRRIVLPHEGGVQ
jgi:hypothetical protein